MQADMIVELWNMYQTKINPVLMQKLLMADNRLIVYIINNKIELAKLEKYFYLPLFNDYDYETQVMIFENDEGQFEKIFSLLKSSEPKDAKKILKSIYNCKEAEIVKLAIEFLNSTVNIKFFDKKEIFKILLKSKSCRNCGGAYDVASNNDVEASGHLIELTKIVANAKNPYEACNTASNLSNFKCENVVELTKIVANAQTKKNAEFTCDIIQNTDVIKSNKIIEIATLFANTNPNNLYGMYKLVISGFLEVLICLMDVFKSKINPNNFDAVIDLLVTGNYELSKNPTESLVKILRSTNNYEKFDELYADSDECAIKGALELDKEFPGIDIKGNTYVKMSKIKKKNNNNNRNLLS